MMPNAAIVPPAQNAVLLSVWFDVDQISSSLGYEVNVIPAAVAPSDTPNPNPRFGRRAGALYFMQGEQLQLEVVAHSLGRASDFESFRILECCIMTRPQLVELALACPVMKFAAPSPFVQPNGMTSYTLPLDFCDQGSVRVGDDLTIRQRWNQCLDVCRANGRWELSFVLMVAIVRSDERKEQIRVFTFDPESEVGSTGLM